MITIALGVNPLSKMAPDAFAGLSKLNTIILRGQLALFLVIQLFI